MAWFRRRREEDLDEEIRAHLGMAAHDREERGETPEAARQGARAELGNEGLIKEVTRGTWRGAWLDRLAQDVRGTGRMLARSPGFTAVVAITLALGIGANTAIYSIVHAALMPLAIPQPERVINLSTDNLKRNWRQFPVSVPDFEDWQASGVFQSVAAFTDSGVNLRVGDHSDRLDAKSVTAGFLEVIGVPCRLGRGFRTEEMQPGRDGVVVLTDPLWRSRFASDPGILGRTIIVDGAPFEVIGVLPASFPRFEHEEIYKPLVFDAAAKSTRGQRFFGAIGRLRAGVTLDAARRRMTELSQRLSSQYPEDSGNVADLEPIQDAMVQDARALLLTLFGAVGFLLLIACANIANLLLARGTSRAKELAIRAALGAGRWRLCRQLLTESVVLSLAGGVLAVLPAMWAIHFLATRHLEEVPNAEAIAMNFSVLAFNLVLALITGVIFGLIPAWQFWRADVNGTLKATARSYTGGADQRLRSFFVVSELALTFVLLVGAGLMTRSFLRMLSTNPGFDADHVLTMRTELSSRKYDTPEKQAAFFEGMQEKAQRLPEVLNAGLIDDLPTSDSLHGRGMYFPGRPEPRSENIPMALVSTVSGDYFRTMRIPLLRGRYFSNADRKNAPMVAVIDKFTAERYWPGEDAIGRQLKLGKKAPVLEIVGVVGDVSQNVMVRIMKGRVAEVYLSFLQQPDPAMAMVFRTAGDPASVAPAMRAMDVDQPLFQVRTLEEALSAGRASQQMATLLLGGFSAIALLLTTVGIYGVIAYNVGQRTREFGIRMSLGAQPGDVLRLVLRQGVMLAGVGAAIGLLGAFALTRLMSSLLYDIGATDPLTFTAVTVVMVLTTLLAGYVPARRAMRVDPVRALHHE